MTSVAAMGANIRGKRYQALSPDSQNAHATVAAVPTKDTFTVISERRINSTAIAIINTP